MEERKAVILEAIKSGQIRERSWGMAVATYLFEHPEEGEEMGIHHYRDFLRKKLEMMVSDIQTGRHISQIAVHRMMRIIKPI